MEKIGAFGLTEPDVGSGAAGGLTTTARRAENGRGEHRYEGTREINTLSRPRDHRPERLRLSRVGRLRLRVNHPPGVTAFPGDRR